MDVPTITSRQNAIVSRYRAAARADDRARLLLDGPHLVGEALDAGIGIVEAAVRADAAGGREIALIVNRLRALRVEVFTIATPVMSAISPLRSTSPIAAIATRPLHTEAGIYAAPLSCVLIAADIQDPGNLGAMVRVAEAAGADGMIAAGACADPYGWKAIRGSMGSALRLPVAASNGAHDAVIAARRHRCRIVATAPRGGKPLFEAALDGPVALVIGGEAAGIPGPVLRDADEVVTIPMAPTVESLNAAVAAALLLYEVKRRRPGKGASA